MATLWVPRDAASDSHLSPANELEISILKIPLANVLKPESGERGFPGFMARGLTVSLGWLSLQR